MIDTADWALLQQPAPVGPATHPPAGLLSKAADAGAIATSLDALIDAVAVIESLPGGQATHIIANPSAYAALRQFKKGTGSNESLLGAGTEAGPKTLLSLPVFTTSAMPADKLLVLDKAQVLSAYGDFKFARSDDYYFGSDNVALRATLRFGAGPVDADAIQVLTVDL